ncbi:MAG TPA: helix-turn-helix transcriptional regulator [Anaerolineales bacterium]|nr:helix-turn-helix transcriptional regulator [Anaerolineales bacterium]
MGAALQIEVRTKKLGVLIRDARLGARRGLDECAKAMGITRSRLKSYESGRRAPSLPEIEALAYFLNVPIEHFWGKTSISDQTAQPDALDLPQVVQLRQRIIGALVRQERDNAHLSIKALSKDTGISAARIKAYELGERPIPMPELEALASSLAARVESFADESGPIGMWMMERRSVKNFLELPPELQAFVGQPVNRPFLELAMKLSSMPVEKLRSVAEGLLDITL